MDAVAARAHASKTTIYRRWRGKPELVKAAVDGYVAGRVPSWADTGSLRGDLMTVMLAMRGHLTDEFLAMMSGLIHAMRTEPSWRPCCGRIWPVTIRPLCPSSGARPRGARCRPGPRRR